MRSRAWNRRLKTLALIGVLISLSEASADPWVQHAGRLAGLQREVETIEQEVKHLIAEKRHVTDPATVKMLTDQIADRHRSLEKAAKEFEEERLHVRFQHPDRADITERKYVRYQLKSVQQMEGEVGIDGRLDRVKTKVLATFPIPDKAAIAPEEPKVNSFFRKPASVDEYAPDHIKLVK